MKRFLCIATILLGLFGINSALALKNTASYDSKIGQITIGELDLNDLGAHYNNSGKLVWSDKDFEVIKRLYEDCPWTASSDIEKKNITDDIEFSDGVFGVFSNELGLVAAIFLEEHNNQDGTMHHVYVERCVVRADCQNKGIGGILLKHVLFRSRFAGNNFELSPSNIDSERFYERLGFFYKGNRGRMFFEENHVKGKTPQAIRMKQRAYNYNTPTRREVRRTSRPSLDFYDGFNYNNSYYGSTYNTYEGYGVQEYLNYCSGGVSYMPYEGAYTVYG